MKFMTKAQRVMASKAGEGYIDTVVKVIIAVVIGALVITALVYLINNVAFPAAEEKVDSLFSEEFDYSSSVGA